MPEYIKAIPSAPIYSSNRGVVGHPTFNVNVNVGADIGNGPQTDSPSGVRSNGMLPFHGEASYVSASGGQAFVLYAGGETTPRALGANEQIVVTDYLVTSPSGANIAIGMDANASGSIMVKSYGVVGVSKSLETPIHVPIGVVPKVYCDIGRVDAAIHGYILI